MTRLLHVVCVSTLLLAFGAMPASAQSYEDFDKRPGECKINVEAGSFGGTQGAESRGACLKVQNGGMTTRTGPPTVTKDCGRPGVGAPGTWNGACGAKTLECYDIDPKTGKRIQLNAMGTFVDTRGKPLLNDVWCPQRTQPMPSRAALRQQVLALLPSVQIGSAWTTRALVNAETILWAATDAHRTLATVTVVGRRVQLRISFDHADWNYGDRTGDTTTDPGAPYTDTNPCATADCPDYFGHTYRATGPVTVTLTVAWHAEFSLDNGNTWDDIDAAPLTGPAATHRFDIVQARAVLVPDPDR